MSYLKLSKQCGDDCLTAFDTGITIPDLVRCERTADCCGGCTCLDLGLELGQTPIDSFDQCFCSTSEDHKSDTGTIATKSFGYRWPSDSAVTAAILAAYAATVCEGSSDVIWKFFGRSSAEACPVSTTTWTHIQVSIDGGAPTDEAVNPVEGTSFGLYDATETDGGQLNCGAAPGAILLQIRTGCGALLVLCPLAGSDPETVVCPAPQRCCCPSLGTCFAEGCEDGSAVINYTVHLTAAISPCECDDRTGSIAVIIGDYVDSHDISSIEDDGDLSGSFIVPCTGEDGESVRIVIEWSAGAVCADGIDCPCTAPQCFQVPIAGGDFLPVPCS